MLPAAPDAERVPPSVARDLPGKRSRANSPQLPRAHEVRPRASRVVRQPKPVRPKDDVRALDHGLTITPHAMAIRGDARERLSSRERRAVSSAARARRRSSLNDRRLKSTPSPAKSSGSRLSDFTRPADLRSRATRNNGRKMPTLCHTRFGTKRPNPSATPHWWPIEPLCDVNCE